ncbi:hypothetical protein FIBSPDRAFT_855161 [Athelia psychrophila]|uniref:Uncharacterized protein n=1 Tax=Athelia psychrophila TaxID=1759441 RepID=A0A166PKU8_9AGAM|nr:hypothetical protein FIBSPDRAFT_855161 [Fibularhizoctonia sp. CBS 109695]
MRVCCVNESPAPDDIHVEIARGEIAIALPTFATPASSSSPGVTTLSDVSCNPT